MKRSEKLFMLINKIDENIISDAKDEPQKPNRITIEKRAFPIRETVAAAACFAVLAVGIFAVMRFRINSVEPEDSNPVTSSGSTLNSNNSEYSDEDLELQAILAELEPGYKICDWFFDGVPEIGEARHFYFSETDPYGDFYYPLSAEFPQSYDEMEELVYKYYTDYTAGVFMKYVCHAGNMTQRADGSCTITVEDKGREENNRNPTFIEADGKLYGRYIGRGNSGTPHFDTARVKTKTESAINFTYLHVRGEEEFSDADGTIKYERGGWRLSYYMGWLDQNDDMALQEKLKNLTASAGEIDGIFNKMSVVDGTPDIKAGSYEYYLIPENTKTEPNGLFTVPQTYDEMEELVSRFFSKRAAEFYMSDVGKGRLVKDQNGETKIEFENQIKPAFLEIDGKMYRSNIHRDIGALNLGIDCDTAKITSKTNKSIEFSYMGFDRNNWYSGGDKYAERNGAIVYEDGNWKLNYFYNNGFIPEMPNEYTDEDLELQEILKELRPGEDVRALFSLNSVPANGQVYNFILPDKNEPEGAHFHYIDVSGEQPREYSKQPRSLDELKQMLLQYFTEESTDHYMNQVCKGTMTENGDGTYNVTLDKDIFFPVYIEINGKMFYRSSAASGSGRIYNTEKVVYKTNDTIIYSYVYYELDWYDKNNDTIKYERGGWKIAPYDSDPEKKSELNTDILSDLGLTYDQMVEKYGKLKTNTYKGVMFENSDLIYGWKSETGKDYYVDNDHTNPGTLPEAGGCNVILGVNSSDLLTDFIRGISFEKFCERYGFVLVYESDDPNYPGYTAEFSHPLYPGVRFCADNENFHSINFTTAWWIFLDVDCKDAKPVI